MKRSIIMFVTGLCCAICMAQPLDTARIESEWNKITAYCCAQYEIAHLSSTKDAANANSMYISRLRSVTVDNTFVMEYVRNINKEINKIAGIKEIEQYFDSLDNVSNKIQSWSALFPTQIKNISGAGKDAELKGKLSDLYSKKDVNKPESPREGSSLDEVFSFDMSIIEIILLSIVGILLLCIIVLRVRLFSLRQEMDALKGRINTLEGNSYTISKHSYKEKSHSSSDASALKDLSMRLEKLESVVLTLISKDTPAKPASIQEPLKEVKTEREESRKEDNIQERIGIFIYLKNFNAGILKECVTNEAQYELILADKQAIAGEFSFVGDVNAAIATKDATFEDVCDLENWSTSAKSCTTSEKGKAEKMSDGKWRVVRKGKVKFS